MTGTVQDIPFPLTDDVDDEEDEGQEEVPAPAPKKKRAKPSGLGAPAHNTPKGWANKEADFMWAEMVQALRSNGHSPHEITVRVMRMDPNAVTMPGSIDGSAIAGSASETPGEAFLRVFDQYYHLPTARQPATYDCLFNWKATGAMYGRGRIGRPHPDEIVALQRAALANQQASNVPAPGSYAVAGYGAPPPPGYASAAAPVLNIPQYPPPQYPPLPPTYVYQPPAPAPQPAAPTGPSPLEQHLMAQNQMLIEWARQMGMQPPAGLAAPPPPPAAPPAAQPAQPAMYAVPQNVGLGGAFDQLDQLFSTLERADSLKQRFAARFGYGAPQEASAEAPEPEEPEEKPSPGFHVIPIPETTLKFAKDKETGDINWGATAMVNADSEIGKKVLDLAGNFVQNLTKLAGVSKDGHVLPTGVGAPQLGAPHNPAYAPNGYGANGASSGWKP